MKSKPSWMQAVPQLKVGKTVISPLQSTLSKSEKMMEMKKGMNKMGKKK